MLRCLEEVTLFRRSFLMDERERDGVSDAVGDDSLRLLLGRAAFPHTRASERPLPSTGRGLLLRGRPGEAAVVLRRIARQVPLSAPVGVHDVDFAVAVALADECDLPPVG